MSPFQIVWFVVAVVPVPPTQCLPLNTTDCAVMQGYNVTTLPNFFGHEQWVCNAFFFTKNKIYLPVILFKLHNNYYTFP